ncbi:serine hydrolase [Modestobacter sp. URMC 112]
MIRPGPRSAAGLRPLLAAALVALVIVAGAIVRATVDAGPTDTAEAGAHSGSVPGAAAPPASADAPEPSTGPTDPADDPADDPDDGRDTAGGDGGGTSPTVPSDSPPAGPAPSGSLPEEAARPGRSGGEESAPGPTPAAPPAVDTPAVLAALAEAGSRASGTVEAVVLGPDGGELLASPGAGDTRWTASLSKTLLVSQLLDRDGGPVPAPEDLRLVERALTSSDDSAMNTLWTRFDGPALLGEASADYGLTGTGAPADPSQWGEATTTARDYARFLHGLEDALDPAAFASVTGWLRSATPTAADGFDQTFGLLSDAVRAGGPVAAKQGWMCCVGGRRQLHSAGWLDDGRVVVLLGDFPSSAGWAAAHGALDAAALAVVTGT